MKESELRSHSILLCGVGRALLEFVQLVCVRRRDCHHLDRWWWGPPPRPSQPPLASFQGMMQWKETGPEAQMCFVLHPGPSASIANISLLFSMSSFQKWQQYVPSPVRSPHAVQTSPMAFPLRVSVDLSLRMQKEGPRFSRRVFCV